MYNEEQLLAANPIDRFAIGDRDKLAFNPDGSLDLYIQREFRQRQRVELAAGSRKWLIHNEHAALLAQGRGARRYLVAAGDHAGEMRFWGETNYVSYRNPKERIHARTLYYGDNDDARNRPRSDIFRRRATWPCSVFV